LPQDFLFSGSEEKFVVGMKNNIAFKKNSFYQEKNSCHLKSLLRFTVYKAVQLTKTVNSTCKACFPP